MWKHLLFGTSIGLVLLILTSISKTYSTGTVKLQLPNFNEEDATTYFTTESEDFTTEDPTTATTLSYSKMSITNECCTLPAIESDYQPIGTETKLNDFTIYETGNLDSKVVLISVYDIFGFHPNTKQFCDKLAKVTGYRVIMPDFFRGSPWSNDNFPPKDRQVLLDWVMKAGSWTDVVKLDLVKILEHYKSQGATGFGIFGFCWGGKMSVQAVGDSDLINDIRGAGIIHGSFIDDKEADAVKKPVLLLPSQTEPDMLPFQKRVQERLGEDFAEHVRFDDMVHGFAAARGDFNDELTRKRVEEVIQLLKTFFKKHIK